jgi:5-methylcytosine-specific restriction endonuclease McrA
VGIFAKHGVYQTPRRRRGGHSSAYIAYLNSPQWQQRRDEVLEDADYTCEQCGRSRPEVTLEVHHESYENLGREEEWDLTVLCSECHEEADAERRASTEERRFQSWATKVYGENWELYHDRYEVEEEFDEWLQDR